MLNDLQVSLLNGVRGISNDAQEQGDATPEIRDQSARVFADPVMLADVPPEHVALVLANVVRALAGLGLTAMTQGADPSIAVCNPRIVESLAMAAVDALDRGQLADLDWNPDAGF